MYNLKDDLLSLFREKYANYSMVRREGNVSIQSRSFVDRDRIILLC